jgi:hypothetical protein
MLRDLNEPIKDWFPFIFHNWITNKNNVDYYDHYLCFINIEKMFLEKQLYYL